MSRRKWISWGVATAVLLLVASSLLVRPAWRWLDPRADDVARAEAYYWDEQTTLDPWGQPWEQLDEPDGGVTRWFSRGPNARFEAGEGDDILVEVGSPGGRKLTGRLQNTGTLYRTTPLLLGYLAVLLLGAYVPIRVVPAAQGLARELFASGWIALVPTVLCIAGLWAVLRFERPAGLLELGSRASELMLVSPWAALGASCYVGAFLWVLSVRLLQREEAEEA